MNSTVMARFSRTFFAHSMHFKGFFSRSRLFREFIDCELKITFIFIKFFYSFLLFYTFFRKQAIKRRMFIKAAFIHLVIHSFRWEIE
jgi:hypothetical protein